MYAYTYEDVWSIKFTAENVAAHSNDVNFCTEKSCTTFVIFKFENTAQASVIQEVHIGWQMSRCIDIQCNSQSKQLWRIAKAIATAVTSVSFN